MTDPFKRGSAPGRERPEHQRPGTFKRGREKRGGRKRGTRNAFSADYKRAILDVPLQLEERQPEKVDIDVVKERGEPFLLPLPCCLSYAFQRL